MNKINNILKSTNIFSKNINNNMYQSTRSFLTFNSSNYINNNNYFYNKQNNYKFNFDNNNGFHQNKRNPNYFNQSPIITSLCNNYYNSDFKKNNAKNADTQAVATTCYFFKSAIAANQSIINMKKSINNKLTTSNQVKNMFSTFVSSKLSLFKFKDTKKIFSNFIKLFLYLSFLYSLYINDLIVYYLFPQL